MRSLAVVEFLTLDGVMQGLGSPDEDRDGGFEHGGWGAAYADQCSGRRRGRGCARPRRTCSGAGPIRGWPRTGRSVGSGSDRRQSEPPTQVRSHHDPDHSGLGRRARAPRRRRRVREELKADGEGFISVLGSGELVQALIAHGLVDDYRLFVHPLVLGTGKRLFRETPRPIPLRLVDCTPTTPASYCSATSPREGRAGRPLPTARAQVPRQRTTSSATAIWTALSLIGRGSSSSARASRRTIELRCATSHLAVRAALHSVLMNVRTVVRSSSGSAPAPRASRARTDRRGPGPE